MEDKYTRMKKSDNSAIKIVKHNPRTQNDLEVELNLVDASAKINFINHQSKEIHSVVMTGDAFNDLMDLCEQIKGGDTTKGDGK